MADRLAVTPHRGDPGRIEPRPCDRGQGRVGEEMPDLDIEPGDAGVGGPLGGRDFQQVPAEPGWDGMAVRVEEADGAAGRLERRDDRVDGVDARSGDESQVRAGQRLSAIQARELRGADGVDPSEKRPDRALESLHFRLGERRGPG